VEENYKTELTIHIPHKVFYTLYNLLSITIGVKDGQAIISRMLGDLLRTTMGAAGVPSSEALINSSVQENMAQIVNLLNCINRIPREVLTKENIEICLKFGAEPSEKEITPDDNPFEGLDFDEFTV
jgi:hypothetical protein